MGHRLIVDPFSPVQARLGRLASAQCVKSSTPNASTSSSGRLTGSLVVLHAAREFIAYMLTLYMVTYGI